MSLSFWFLSVWRITLNKEQYRRLWPHRDLRCFYKRRLWAVLGDLELLASFHFPETDGADSNADCRQVAAIGSSHVLSRWSALTPKKKANHLHPSRLHKSDTRVQVNHQQHSEPILPLAVFLEACQERQNLATSTSSSRSCLLVRSQASSPGSLHPVLEVHTFIKACLSRTSAFSPKIANTKEY